MSIVPLQIPDRGQIVTIPTITLQSHTSHPIEINRPKPNFKNIMFDMNSKDMEINRPYRIDEDLALIKTEDDQIHIIDLEPNSII